MVCDLRGGALLVDRVLAARLRTSTPNPPYLLRCRCVIYSFFHYFLVCGHLLQQDIAPRAALQLLRLVRHVVPAVRRTPACWMSTMAVLAVTKLMSQT